MNKRGQITLFIIVGLVIIAIFAILLYTKKEVSEVYVPSTSEPVKNLIQNCFYRSAEDGVYSLSSNGGAFYSDNVFYSGEVKDKKEVSYLMSNYFYFDGKNLIPSLDDFEGDLSVYVETLMNACLFEDNASYSEDYVLLPNNFSVVTNINEKGVFFETEDPLVILDNNKRIKSGRFFTNVSVNLDYMHEVSSEIVDIMFTEDRGLVDYLYNTGLNVSVYDFEEDIVVYRLENLNKNLNGEPYFFMFAAKY